jgi:hypothetical protein
MDGRGILDREMLNSAKLVWKKKKLGNFFHGLSAELPEKTVTGLGPSHFHWVVEFLVVNVCIVIWVIIQLYYKNY